MTKLLNFAENAHIQSDAPHEYSVSEISRILKAVVEDNFDHVRVRGELSGFKYAPSGHAYFNLKDHTAVLRAVCWKGVASILNFKLEDGLEVVVSGKISIYEGQSTYQVIAQKIELAGVGALLALLEKRKALLAAEGLFDANRKRPIPFLPKTIGVVTSPTGAVIRDILHRISARMGVHVLIWPVLVQGTDAASQIASAIQGFNNLPNSITKPDIIIVARGGGSIEDLWAFNEEIVVRAAANSTIPLISAVGHETDTTLIDYASDKRAPTPTAAAEMATPVKTDLMAGLQTQGHRLLNALPNTTNNSENKLNKISTGLINFSQKLTDLAFHLKTISHKLEQNLLKFTSYKSERFERTAGRLSPLLILISIRVYESRLIPLTGMMVNNTVNLLVTANQKVSSLGRLLDSFNYKNVLKRGFTLAKDTSGKIISSKELAKSLGNFALEFSDGVLKVSTSSSKSKYNGQAKLQGSLFD
jgi:exodeoxyribonuclease VII large subunit